jgi:hypothetical protein
MPCDQTTGRWGRLVEVHRRASLGFRRSAASAFRDRPPRPGAGRDRRLAARASRRGGLPHRLLTTSVTHACSPSDRSRIARPDAHEPALTSNSCAGSVRRRVGPTAPTGARAGRASKCRVRERRNGTSVPGPTTGTSTMTNTTPHTCSAPATPPSRASAAIRIRTAPFRPLQVRKARSAQLSGRGRVSRARRAAARAGRAR